MSACVQPIPALVAPPGMYVLEGRLYVRRFAPARTTGIKCPRGHHLTVHGRPLSATPQCESLADRGRRCPANFYLYRLSKLRYLVLDVTLEEAQTIHAERMDIDDVIAYFGLHLPGDR